MVDATYKRQNPVRAYIYQGAYLLKAPKLVDTIFITTARHINRFVAQPDTPDQVQLLDSQSSILKPGSNLTHTKQTMI